MGALRSRRSMSRARRSCRSRPASFTAGSAGSLRASSRRSSRQAPAWHPCSLARSSAARFPPPQGAGPPRAPARLIASMSTAAVMPFPLPASSFLSRAISAFRVFGSLALASWTASASSALMASRSTSAQLTGSWVSPSSGARIEFEGPDRGELDAIRTSCSGAQTRPSPTDELGECATTCRPSPRPRGRGSTRRPPCGPAVPPAAA